MKQIFTLLVLVLLVLAVSGCTQSSPGTAVQKPTAAITKSPVTVQKTIVTPRPAPIAIPTTEQAPTVSDNTILIENFAFNPQVITWMVTPRRFSLRASPAAGDSIIPGCLIIPT